MMGPEKQLGREDAVTLMSPQVCKLVIVRVDVRYM
jgi:hypothetical protein